MADPYLVVEPVIFLRLNSCLSLSLFLLYCQNVVIYPSILTVLIILFSFLFISKRLSFLEIHLEGYYVEFVNHIVSVLFMSFCFPWEISLGNIGVVFVSFSQQHHVDVSDVL